MLGGIVTLPFHLRHRHPSGPDTQTSALSWSVTPTLRSRSLESSDVMPPRTGHSTQGCVRRAVRGVCRERTWAGGGRWGGQWHICPQLGRVSATVPRPASTGRGRKEAAHTADSPPAWRPSCACQSCLRIAGNLVWQCPPPPTHTPHQLCHI